MSLLQEIEKYGLADTEENRLLQRAYGIAEGLFYCDDECQIPWEPFEYWTKKELTKEINSLSDSIYQAMKWAINQNKGV